MATRRQCREWALQMLFQLDLNPCDDLEALFRTFWSNQERPPSDRHRRFAEELVAGVQSHRAQIDATIQSLAEHWDLGRMGVVDRNVLRMALYELTYREDIPPAVTINEAVDIAKYFSNTESGKFVNGILDRARKDLKRPAKS